MQSVRQITYTCVCAWERTCVCTFRAGQRRQKVSSVCPAMSQIIITQIWFGSWMFWLQFPLLKQADPHPVVLLGHMAFAGWRAIGLVGAADEGEMHVRLAIWKKDSLKCAMRCNKRRKVSRFWKKKNTCMTAWWFGVGDTVTCDQLYTDSWQYEYSLLWNMQENWTPCSTKVMEKIWLSCVFAWWFIHLTTDCPWINVFTLKNTSNSPVRR